MDSQGKIVVGQYLLTRTLGEGSMGKVWLALDIGLDREVAVKLLHPHSADRESGRFTDRFLREAKATAKLSRCRHVPQVHSFGDWNGAPYLVMEYIEGPTLERFMANHHPLSIEDIVALVTQIAVALAHAHDAGLVHRDLKPSNVMIAEDGVVKILDFGIVALSDPQATRLTATGFAPGTAAYMAPEQASRGLAEPRSDLYAVGCILFELLTGEQVFSAETAHAMARCHMDEIPRRVAQLRECIPPWLADLTDSLLNKDPDRRPEDARALYARLQSQPPGRCTPRPPRPAPDPTLPLVNPCSPPPRPTATTQAPPRNPRLPSRARRNANPVLKRADLVRIRQESDDLAIEGKVLEAIALIERCLDVAIGRFGRTDEGVLLMRIDRAQLLQEAGPYETTLKAYRDVRPDAVRHFGAESEQVRKIDDGINDCEEAVGE